MWSGKRLTLSMLFFFYLGQVFEFSLKAEPTLRIESKRKTLEAYEQLHKPKKTKDLESLKLICQKLLKKALSDKDPYNRIYAAASLIEMGNLSFFDVLKKEISNPEPLVRVSAYLEMIEMEKKGKLSVIPMLKNIFTVEEAAVKILTLESLKDEADNSIFPLLEWAIKSDNNYIVKSIAAEVLGEISHPSSLALLKKAAEDEHILVRLSAMSSLARRGEKAYLRGLIEALKGKDPSIRETAAGLMGRVRDKSVVPLLEKILDQEKSPSVKITVAGSLAELGDAAGISYLQRMLDEKNFYLRLHAIKALGRAAQTSCLPLFKKALKDDNPMIRIFAISFIGKMRDKSAIPLLEKALKDKDAGVRMASAQVLGEIGNLKTIDPLIEASKDKDLGVKITALRAIARLINSR